MASPPFLRGLSSKTPKIEPFLWGGSFALGFVEGGTTRGSYLLSNPHSSLFFKI
jgi:hypothetical protein